MFLEVAAGKGWMTSRWGGILGGAGVVGGELSAVLLAESLAD
jgi:hypothetical protein